MKARVLHILTKLELGGAQWNTVLSVEDQCRRGYDAWLLAADGELGEEARRRLGARWIACPALVREVALTRDARALGVVGEHLRRLSPHLVHTHSSKAGIVGRWAAVRARTPVIIHTAHGWGFHRGQGRAAYEAFRWAERLTAPWTDRIVVVADADRGRALAEGVGRPEQYVTIRSGIAVPDGPLSAERRAAIRAALGVGSGAGGEGGDDLLVSWIGNFKPQKSPQVLVDVVRRCLEVAPHLRFAVVGDGPLRGDVERELGGDSRVSILGWRRDASEILEASDLLLHTALHEGLPRVILEACVRGIPSVTTDVDGIPEIARDGVTGVMTGPGDVAALAEGVLRLARDPELRARCASGARAAFRDEFRLATMLARLDDLYRERLRARGVAAIPEP